MLFINNCCCYFLIVLVLGVGVGVAGVQARKIVPRFHATSTAKDLRKYAELGKGGGGKTPSNLDIDGPLLKPFLIPRVSGSKGNLDVQEFIIKSFTDLGWHIEQDKFTEEQTPFGEITFNNIIVTKDVKAHRKLVLAAHYDSKYFKDFNFIGATDSAVPCAILLHIAITLNDLLDKRRESLANLLLVEGTDETFPTIQFIFFDGEEAMIEWSDTDSIYGAKHLARLWGDSMVTMINPEDGQLIQSNILDQIDAIVLLDLLGTKNAKIQNAHKSTQWIWNRLVRLQEKLESLKLLSPNMLARFKKGDYLFTPGMPTISETAIQDDHLPFYLKGVPISHIIPVPFPKEWHTIRDNANCLHQGTIEDISLIFRLLVAEYLGLNEYL